MTSDDFPIAHGVQSDWLLNALSRRGLRLSQICRELNISMDEIKPPCAWVSFENYVTIFNWAAVELDDPNLGMHLSREIAPEHYGVFGYLLANASSLREWLEVSQRYLRTLAPDNWTSFSRDGAHIKCTYEILHLDPEKVRQDVELACASKVNYIRQFEGPDWTPTACTFSFSKPRNIAEHHSMFGTKISFNAPANTFSFPAELMKKSAGSGDPALMEILRRQADRLLEHIDIENDLVRQVELLLTTAISSNDLSAELVAAKLNVSSRHLNRLLAKHNTTYKQLREKVVLRAAKEALADTNSNISAISHKLGYSEASAFVRSFKRLEGITPLQYRKQSKEVA